MVLELLEQLSCMIISTKLVNHFLLMLDYFLSLKGFQNWNPESMQVQDYVLSVRAKANYASEAYSFDLVDTTGKLPDIMLGSIPEATSGVTASHMYML